MKNKKSKPKNIINYNFNRNYTLILYPEDITHMYALTIIQEKYDYAMIKHDKDILESGELKKEHYHVIIHFKNARYKKAIAKELGIEENYLTGCDLKAQLRYLIHIDDKDKYQYDMEEVEGTQNMKKIFLSYIETNKRNISLEIKEIIQGIKENKIRNIDELMIWACDNGYINIILNNAYIFTKLLERRITFR